MYDILELSKKLLPELKEIAKELKIKKTETLKKQDLIYKILDQQAIVATDKSVKPEPEIDASKSKPDSRTIDSESAARRGKRPRTSKPVINRKIESVISVSPEDLIKPDEPAIDQPDEAKTTEATEDVSNAAKAENQSPDVKSSKWTADQRAEKRVSKSEMYDKLKNKRPEQSRSESYRDTKSDSRSNVDNGKTSSDDIKPSDNNNYNEGTAESNVRNNTSEPANYREEGKTL